MHGIPKREKFEENANRSCQIQLENQVSGKHIVDILNKLKHIRMSRKILQGNYVFELLSINANITDLVINRDDRQSIKIPDILIDSVTSRPPLTNDIQID
jgi:hypothetical protein